MKKILGILSVGLLPIISSAQGYMMGNFARDYGYNCFGSNGSMWGIFFALMIPLLFIAVGVGAFVFWIMMLVDAIKNASEKTKLVWVVVIVFTHIIGAFIYYFIEKRPRNKHASAHTEHKKEGNN